MHKTFNLENMETYFYNYVPCLEHRREPITNFCTERICLKFMCPECVENHSLTHANHPIESIKTCIKKTSGRLNQTAEQLQQEANRNNFMKHKTPEEYENELIKELEEVRASIIQDINSYFREKQQQVRRETSKTQQIKIKMKSLRDELTTAIAQLRLLDNNLYVNTECVKAIKKANKIDYPGLILHFKKKISDVQNDMNVNLKVELNQAKRDELRRVINSLIGIKSKNLKASSNMNLSNMSRKNLQPYRVITEEAINSERVDYVVNPPPLSADRLMNQAAFRIDCPNYFDSEPFLHFFEHSKSNLHILRLKELKDNEPPKWIVIPLNIGFQMPYFHRTVATENGNIYLIGGTIAEKSKSKMIYQFDPMNSTLKQVSQLAVGRSSHSLACFKKNVYIVGGMGEGDQIPKKCEFFNSRTNETKLIAPCKYATMNSTLCTIGSDNLVKLGGIDMDAKNSDYIEIYNITADLWGEIDPTIENVRGEFGLLSCSGWAPLNEDQVFIFGGYNEDSDSENSKMSFVFEYNKEERQFYIKYVNLKNLPLAEGFWNPQSIIHQGKIYALQNVDGEQISDCLEDKRNLLIFNGKYWSTCFCSE